MFIKACQENFKNKNVIHFYISNDEKKTADNS